MKNYKIGFIGYGNMSAAIIAAATGENAKKEFAEKGFGVKFSVSDRHIEKLSKAPENVKIYTYAENTKMVADSDILVIAVKPQSAKEALAGLDFSGKTVISVMAGISIKLLKILICDKTDKIVRVMPNLNARIGKAFSVFCGQGLNEDETEVITALLNTFGKAREVQEPLIDVATGISGSGPAFVFKFIKAFYETAVKNGFDKDTARDMAVGTVIGSACLAAEGGDIDELIRSVCSKGGTTLAGVRYLDENGFEETVGGAAEKAAERAREMLIENEAR